MLILTDTSTLIWWMHNDKRLGKQARRLLQDGANQIVVSSISIHEYAIKARLKKLPKIDDMKSVIEKQGFFAVSFTANHAQEVFRVPKLSWKDPFDLALMAHARILQANFLTSDKKILAEAPGYIECQDARQ